MIPLPPRFKAGSFEAVIQTFQTRDKAFRELDEMFKTDIHDHLGYLSKAFMYRKAIEYLQTEVAQGTNKEDALISLSHDTEDRLHNLALEFPDHSSSDELFDIKVGLILLKDDLEKHEKLSHF